MNGHAVCVTTPGKKKFFQSNIQRRDENGGGLGICSQTVWAKS